MRFFDATLLGSAFGRDSLAYIGVLPDENSKNGGLTVQLQADIARFAFSAAFGLSGRRRQVYYNRLACCLNRRLARPLVMIDWRDDWLMR